MAKKRRGEARVEGPASTGGTEPARGPGGAAASASEGQGGGGRRLQPWLAVVLVAVVAAAAWWAAGAMARRAQGGVLPPMADLAALPGPAAGQVREADAAARDNPRSADAAGALGMAYHASLMTDRALETYALAERLDPASWQWTYYRGLLLEERGRQDEALEAFRRVTAANSGMGMAWFRIGEMAFKAGRLDEAEQAYGRAGAAPPMAPFTTAGVAERRVAALAAYAQMGAARVALDRGRRDQARAALDAAITAYPEFGPARTMRVQLGVEAGADQPSPGRRRSAEAPATAEAPTLRTAARAYVPPADPLLDAVVAKSRMRDMLLKHAALAGRGGDQAWREFLVRRALEFNPRDPNVLMEMAAMLQASGRASEALDYLRQREQVAPGDHQTLVEQGRTLAALGQLEEAEAVLRRAARVRDAAAEYNLGAVLDRRGRLAEARAHYERALEIDPFYARAMNNLGVSLDRNGQIEAAVAMLRRATEADPENAEAFSNLGSALIGSRKLPEAIRALETSIALDPDAPDAHNNLGIALAQSGRLADAAREWETALRIFPGHVNARRNLERLAAIRR
ncbi:MAG: tetratricopeptide repeat protein [Vicinamibacterales bacterium]